MKKIKLIIAIVVVFVFSALLTFSSTAEEYSDYGLNELYDAVPEEIKGYLDENGISVDGNGIENIDIKNILYDIINYISDNIKQPLAMFSSLLAVIILCTIVRNMYDFGNNDSVSGVFTIVSALTSIIIISAFLSSLIETINTAINSVSGFMITYIPVLAGIIAIGGHASTAAVFSSVMIISIEILTQITVNILFPLTSCLVGISVASGVDKDLNIDKLGDGLKKIVVWVLGLLMTIFIGFLTLQSNITASADTIALRIAKFTVSTSVPFVGGAVSDALSTVKSSIEILKSGVGSFGILIGVCILMPIFLNVLCYRFFLFGAGIISGIFGTEDTGRMIKCGENVLSMIISMLICLFLFITVSTAVMLLLCKT